MSFKYVDDKGKMRGYMLAYEGKIKAPNDDYYEDIGDESVLYISDLASDRESMTAGGRLIQAFVDAYRQNYLEKSNLLPIYMEAREQTSYAIVKKQLDKISKDLGIQFELDERGSGQAGEDTMHYIMIRPVRKGDRIGDMRSVEGVKTKEPEKKKSLLQLLYEDDE